MDATTTQQKIHALEHAGLSISEIAKLTGVPQPTIWRNARGKHAQALESTAIAVDRLYSERVFAAGEVSPETAA